MEVHRAAKRIPFRAAIEGALSPWELLLFGAALARSAPGTFPPPRRFARGRAANGFFAPFAAAALFTGLAAATWLPCELEVRSLWAEAAELRARAERHEWERALRAPALASGAGVRAERGRMEESDD